MWDAAKPNLLLRHFHFGVAIETLDFIKVKAVLIFFKRSFLAPLFDDTDSEKLRHLNSWDMRNGCDQLTCSIMEISRSASSQGSLRVIADIWEIWDQFRHNFNQLKKVSSNISWPSCSETFLTSFWEPSILTSINYSWNSSMRTAILILLFCSNLLSNVQLFC